MNQKELLAISVTVFLTVVGWIVADLYHLSITRQVNDTMPRFTQPIKAKVDTEVFKTLEQRQ